MTSFIYGVAPSKAELTIEDQLIADSLNGATRMQLNAASHVRFAEDATPHERAAYVKGAPYNGVPSLCLTSFVGAINRKPHLVTLNGLNEEVFLDEGRLYDSQALIRRVIEAVISFGRIVIVADPGQGDINAQGYVTLYYPGNEVETKFERGRLVKLVLLEDDDTHLVYSFDEDGFVTGMRKSRDDLIIKQMPMRIASAGKPLTEIPAVALNAYSLSWTRALSPLSTICHLARARWNLDLQQAEALWLCASPVWSATGIDEAEIPKHVGPRKIFSSSREGAKFDLISYKGDGLAERRAQALVYDMQMAAAGAQMLMPKGSLAHTVSATVKQVTSANVAPLVEIVRNASLGITIALNYLSSWKGLPSPQVAINEDLVSTQWTSDAMRALHEMYQNGSLSFETFINTLKSGEVIAPTIDPDEESERIESDPTTVLGRKAEDAIRDGLPPPIPGE